MNAIRRALLANSLKTSCVYKKNVKAFLTKIFKDEEKIEKFEHILAPKDSLDILLNMIETGEMYVTIRDDVIYERTQLDKAIEMVYETLSFEQKRKLYLELLNEKNKDKFFDSYIMSVLMHENNMVRILGDSFYDVSFWENLPKNEEGITLQIPIYYDETEFIDYQRIINDENVLRKILEKTEIMKYEAPNLILNEEQISIIMGAQIYWPLKYSKYKTDEIFVANLIMEAPDKASEIFKNISNEIKNSKQVILACTLTGRADLIDQAGLIKENSYNIFVDDTIWFLYDEKDKIDINKLTSNPDYISMFILLTNGSGTEKVSIEEAEDIFKYISEKAPVEIRKIFPMYFPFGKIKELDEVDSFPKNKKEAIKQILNLLHAYNKFYNGKISNEEIDNFINQNPHVIDLIYDSSRDFIRSNKNVVNFYFALCNGVTDLFLEFDYDMMQNINFYYINKNMVDKLGKDILKNIIIYPESYYNLLILEKENRLDMYSKLIKASENIPIDFIRLSNTLVYTCISYPNLIEKLIQNNELNDKNIMKIINLTKLNKVTEYDYNLSIEENYQKIVNFCNDNIDKVENILMAKELFCQRYFKSSYSDVKSLYESFKDSLKNIKDEKVKKLFDVVGAIDSYENVDDIKKAYNTFESNKFETDFTDILSLTTNLKENIVGTLSQTKVPNQNGVIDYTGKEFDFLVHVIGAYGSTIKADSIYESWNSKLRFNNTGLCTSLLGDNYLGHARTKKDSVIFGFDNISAKEVQSMAPYDLYSATDKLETVSFRPSVYYNGTDLINNTRAHHNEVVINRNLLTGDKRQPSYIICFDEINEESKIASEQFGIPIVFIDVKKHIYIKMQEIENLKQNFANTHSLEVATKIINMQETLKCGLLANNQELSNELFNEDYITNNILFLIENCNNINEIENIEKSVNNESDRNLYLQDKRNIPFEADIDLITNTIEIKKESMSESKLDEYFEARKEYQDSEIRRMQTIINLKGERLEEISSNRRL